MPCVVSACLRARRNEPSPGSHLCSGLAKRTESNPDTAPQADSTL